MHNTIVDVQVHSNKIFVIVLNILINTIVSLDLNSIQPSQI